KRVVRRRLGYACANKLGNFAMKSIRIVDVILIAQLVYTFQVFLVLLVKRMAMQPVLEKPIQGTNAIFPFLGRHAYRDRMTFDHDEVAIREYSLQKARHEKITGCF